MNATIKKAVFDFINAGDNSIAIRRIAYLLWMIAFAVLLSFGSSLSTLLFIGVLTVIGLELHLIRNEAVTADLHARAADAGVSVDDYVSEWLFDILEYNPGEIRARWGRW
ncbi:MAG: hypothetical protein VX730_06090 [Pseudomonadota bacterium]|nr:hypothetical protein [Pseudomonadota bacterium]